MWAVIRHLENAGLVKVLDRGPIPQTMREADEVIQSIRAEEIETRSPTRTAERRDKRHRAYDVKAKRAQSVKAKRWARLSKYGRS